MASLKTPDGGVVELASETETVLGRGKAGDDDAPKVDVGRYQGGMTVSRRHAVIHPSESGWYLRVEPEARNQTLVDDQPVADGQEIRLGDEAFIRLGEVVLQFREEPAAPVEPARPVVPLESPASGPLPGWATRLAPGPATSAALATGELKRVNPFRGLMVDETTWRDAHDYQRLLGQLHLLVGHGRGVVDGLEVVADLSAAGSVLVQPGVAIDDQGRTLIVRAPRSVVIPSGATGLRYVRLRYLERRTDPQRAWSDLDEYTRIVESAVVDVDSSPSSAGTIELARIVVSGPPRDATDPSRPVDGEIDLRFRPHVAVQPPPELGVAQLVIGDPAAEAPPHQLGLAFLLREIRLSTPYRPRWDGLARLDQPLPPASLLYLAGVDGFGSLESEAILALRNFLDSGGVLLADGCAKGRLEAFSTWVAALGVATDRPLEPVERWHPLLTARYVFSHPPVTGFQSITLAEKDGLIYSSADLGCSWAGGPDERPFPRELVREALELGVNCAVYARERQFPVEALGLR